jgi:hypothetical protein
LNRLPEQNWVAFMLCPPMAYRNEPPLAGSTVAVITHRRSVGIWIRFCQVFDVAAASGDASPRSRPVFGSWQAASVKTRRFRT